MNSDRHQIALLGVYLGRLPERWRWTLHNVVAHPLSELLYQVGLGDLGNTVHDVTIPIHIRGTGRG